MRDEWFIRGEIPMTKSEVRAVSVSKLELCRDNIVYDIGAGTGSVSVEAALKVPEGHVYAFEQKEEGCALIRANAEKAGVKNLTVVPGKAPESLYGYPAPDRVFLGGSSGNMEEILDLVTELNPAVQLVINVIALESLSQAMEWFRKKGWEPEVVCMQVSRAAKRGPYHMMQAQNPIYVLTAQGQQTHQSQNVPVVPGQNERAQKDADFPRILASKFWRHCIIWSWRRSPVGRRDRTCGRFIRCASSGGCGRCIPCRRCTIRWAGCSTPGSDRRWPISRASTIC